MTYTIRNATNRDVDAIRAVLTEVLAEYGLVPDANGVDADLDDIEGMYASRGGYFQVVESTHDDAPGARVVGCAGLYPLNDSDVELRKMYLLPIARGRGIGRRLLDEAIDEARRRGYRRVRLETASVLKEAIALYQRAGFARVPRPDTADRCDQAWVLDLQPDESKEGERR